MSSRPVQINYLQGVRVCLSAHYIPGPLAAYLLGCLGAEVIKIEPPTHDMLRYIPPFFKGDGKLMSAGFRAINAGFKSIIIDFKHPESKEILSNLIAKCDIFIDGNRPGVISRILGVEIESAFPLLVYVPVSAHGIVGPDRDKAGHDGNVLARSGNLSYTATTEMGTPAVFSAPVADILTAHTAALCAVAATIGRKDSRNPRTIDVSMLHSAFFMNQMQVATMNLIGQVPRPGEEWMNGGLANYRAYRTADEKDVFFGPIEPHLFAKFCQACQREDLIPLLNVQNEQLKIELQTLFASKDLVEWEHMLANVDCCFSRINDMNQAQEDDQIQSLGLVQKVRDPVLGEMDLAGFPAGFGVESLPPTLANRAPEAGEHTEYVLREILNLTPELIEQIKKSGAVRG